MWNFLPVGIEVLSQIKFPLKTLLIRSLKKNERVNKVICSKWSDGILIHICGSPKIMSSFSNDL